MERLKLPPREKLHEHFEDRGGILIRRKTGLPCGSKRGKYQGEFANGGVPSNS